jgi:adenylate cyclase
MDEKIERRLTAIVAANVAEYSRLVNGDEEGTLAALSKHKRELIDPLIADHGGRLANTAGDSLLLEFPSAVGAVRFAIALQEGMRTRNADVPDESRIVFRVGVNVGDVVASGGDLLGHGVNIAL